MEQNGNRYPTSYATTGTKENTCRYIQAARKGHRGCILSFRTTFKEWNTTTGTLNYQDTDKNKIREL